MARSNRSLLRELFQAGDSGNLDAFPSLLHEHVAVHAPFGLSTVGLAAEQASWRRARDAIRDLRHEFLAVLADGSMEAARCVVTGTLVGTLGTVSGRGRPFRIEQALFASIRDGKIEELWEIVDTAPLVEAPASLRPSASASHADSEPPN